MKIIIDRIISLKEKGGVRRYFDNLLSSLIKLGDELKITLSSNLKRTQGDIFHSPYYTRHPDKNMLQVVTVYDMIDEIFPQYSLGLRKRFFRWRKRRVVEKADAIICISQNTKKDLLKTYKKIDKKKVYVIYPGLDRTFKVIRNKKVKNNFLRKHQINKPYLLYVGTRGRYKNFLRLIKAYSQWQRKEDFNLICIGGPKFHQEREINYFNQLKLNNKIHHFPNVSDKDLVLFYNCCHAFVFPSLYEGFGFPLIEAMSCGALVLCANTSTFPEVMKDGGIYFNPKSPKSMLNALNKSLNNKLRKKLIKEGLQRAKDFSWEKAARQTIKVYKKVLQTKQ